jgi:hypothetical protein
MDSQGMKNAKKMLEKLGWSEGIALTNCIMVPHYNVLHFYNILSRQWTGIE